jgi:hypothetical protein
VNSAEQSLRPGLAPDPSVLLALPIMTGQLGEFLSWRAAASGREAARR